MVRLIAIAGLFAGLCGVGVTAAAGQDAHAAATNSAAGTRKPVKKTPAPDSIPDAPAPAADATAPASPTEGADSDKALTGEDQTNAPAPHSSGEGKKHSSAADNPFPEEYSKAATKDAGDSAGDAQGTPATTPGSAEGGDTAKPSSSSGSSSQQGLDKLDLYGDKDKKHRKGADPDAGLPYDPKLAAEDDKIGELYLKNGNAPGAYARFKEATQLDAGDANAVFGLAESARQMDLLEEAAQAYQTYLFAFPDGAKARTAKKALAELKLAESKARK